MIDIARLLFMLPLAVLLVVRTRTLLAYFQQEEYDASRFLPAIGRMRLYDVISSLGVLLLFGASLLLGLEWLALLLIAMVFLAVAFTEYRYRFKKPLSFTPRLKRLYLLSLAVLAPFLPAVLASPFLAIVLIQAVPLAIIAANWVLKPYEGEISESFVDEARQKLRHFNGIRIGITGSFGKTTVKHVLGQVLALEQRPFFSRGSINTVLGLTRHIRQRLQPSHTHFIAEMGAYQIGSIRRLCEFVQPEYGIVTAVGDAHRERFGGIEQTAIAKSELAQWVCEHGQLLVTTEDVIRHRPFADLRARYPEKFMLVGPSDAADVQILSSSVTGQGRTMSLRFKTTGETLTLTSPLLASYNDSNIALVVALVSRIAPQTLPHLAAFLPELEQTQHRLEKKERVSAPLLLDDAYNSNEIGFSEAVEVLGTLAAERHGEAILVTPGIVELGDAHETVHRRLGELSGRRADLIYVVNADRIPSFVAGARADGSKAEIIAVARFNDAATDISKNHNDPRNVVLYENDLPDVLEEKRLL